MKIHYWNLDVVVDVVVMMLGVLGVLDVMAAV